jgi:hypothetical protein
MTVTKHRNLLVIVSSCSKRYDEVLLLLLKYISLISKHNDWWTHKNGICKEWLADKTQLCFILVLCNKCISIWTLYQTKYWVDIIYHHHSLMSKYSNSVNGIWEIHLDWVKYELKLGCIRPQFGGVLPSSCQDQANKVLRVCKLCPNLCK